MAYATFADYEALYPGTELDEAGFDLLIWEAERVMDDITTGADGVRKLRVAKPTKKPGAEAVRRCACALVDAMRQINEAEAAIRKAQKLVENSDGTVQSAAVSSRSSGSESVSYAAVSAAGTAISAAVSDLTAREQLFAATARRYLSGMKDANGVNLLYMGAYPVRLGG